MKAEDKRVKQAVTDLCLEQPKLIQILSVCASMLYKSRQGIQKFCG